jgi:hypothetical protein
MQHSRTLFFVALLAFPALLDAQTPRGPELDVNRTGAGTQWLPDIAAAASGDFVVVWQNGDGLGVGPSNVLARLFRADGSPRSGEIRVSRAEAGRQTAPAVAMRPDGSFVVAWHTLPTERAPGRVFARRFDADGRPAGARFRVGTAAQGDESEADVAIAADGRFAVAWTREDGGLTEVATTDVWVRRFGADGAPLGGEARVNTTTFEEQSQPALAMAPGGDFAVAWASYGGEGTFFDVFVRRFAADGAALGGELQANGGPTGITSQFEPAAAMAADGKLVVVWTDNGGDQPANPLDANDLRGVVGRRFAAGGAPLGEPFRVNSFVRGEQESPAVAFAANGGFLIVWTSGGDQDGDRSGIFARRYAPDGRRSAEFRINVFRESFQVRPAVALAPGGRGAVAWDSVGRDGDGLGVAARRLAAPQ